MPTPPLRRDAQENLQRILASARIVFAERGVEAKLADVAKHAGVGVGTVYRRFASKDELIQALFQTRVDELGAVATRAEEFDEPWDGLEYFLEQSCRMMNADQGLRDLVMNGRISREAMRQSREHYVRRLEALIERAQKNGSLRADFEPGDVPAIMFMLQSTNDFAGSQSPGLWRRMLRIILDGLRSERTEPSALPVAALTATELGSALRARHCTPTEPG
ncbi:TetR/AcrR family transcriptional regulator [Rhodococcus sp. NPDC058521]|uniref:TetR/AcrR family transcriptional regulator n=1 Tax=Rhodococcus sp. NPDC058521 TaxID=3346536 RepID=UPI00365C7020